MPDLSEEQPADIFPDDIAGKHATLEKLVRNNVAIEQDLAKQRVGINPWIIVNMRIDMLLNVLLDEGARYDFEIESAKHVHAMLMQIQQEKAKQKLVLPAKNPLQIA